MYGKQKSNFMSTIVTRFGHRLGHFILCVLLLNFLSTAALSASTIGQNDDLQSDIQSYVICTPQGLKQISLDKNGNPVGDDTDRLEHCVYCLPFQKVALSSSDIDDPLPLANLIACKSHFWQSVSIGADTPLDAACPPRAPPYI